MKGWGARPVLACSGDTPTEQGAGLERLPDRANNLDEHCDAHDVMMMVVAKMIMTMMAILGGK